FGGAPATWATCMLFFQVVLLLGYALADRIVRLRALRVQLIAELVVLGAALAALPVAGGLGARSLTPSAPALHILGLLTRSAGLPYLALSATAPVLQHWYERATARSPYALYAFSNAGSLLGLLAYPTLVEPQLHMGAQTLWWSIAFALFALGM